MKQTISFSLPVADVMVVTPTTIPTAVVGQPYGPIQFAVTSGGLAPFTFTATNLPTGLTLSSDGLLDGTPTAAGNATIMIADSGN